MINYEQEIKKFEKVPETSDVDQVVYGKDLVDIADLLNQVLNTKDSSK